MHDVRQRYNNERGAKERNICTLKDKDSISDVLKKMREKVLTPKPLNEITNDDGPKNILEPGMFGLSRKRL